MKSKYNLTFIKNENKINKLSLRKETVANLDNHAMKNCKGAGVQTMNGEQQLSPIIIIGTIIVLTLTPNSAN